MKNVIIIYGGKSCEHDISIITACLAKGYFANHNVYCVYLDKNNVAYLVPNSFTPAMHVTGKLKQRAVFLFGECAIGILKRSRIAQRIGADVVVNCCHGRCGEDGTVAALCGLLGAPVVGSGITSSAAAMDKILSKRVLNSLGMPTVEGFEVSSDGVGDLSILADGCAYPLIVKPNGLGSSIGVAVCKDYGELTANVQTALRYDDTVLVERALTDFCELNCAAARFDGEVVTSRVDVPVTANDILTFADKYIDGKQSGSSAPEISDELTEQVKTLTAQIYQKVRFSGVVRVDYLYDNVGQKLYVNEINSIPGSLAYGLFNDAYTLTEYGDALVNQAEREFADARKLTTVFPSSVLTSNGGAKGKK